MNDATSLERLERLAREVGSQEIAAEAAALLERGRQRRFYVACVGEFKRGKSTLINALVNQPVLPTGVVPITSVPTVLRYGDPGARVRMEGSWRTADPARLAHYVSEDGNPGNAKQVTGVEVFLPHPLLRDGLCLVDTPGLGSVFDANTASTMDFLPQIDAAIVVVGGDPPISGEELRYVTELSRQVETLLFVLNKADRISAADRAEAVRFATVVLGKALGRPVESVYQTSATIPGWAPKSAPGWKDLQTALERLPHTAGDRLVQSAMQRGTAHMCRRLEVLLGEERRALVQPLNESERRIAALNALSSGAARARLELAPLLAAEEQRLAEAFKERRVAFLQRDLAVAHQALELRLLKLRTKGRLRRRHHLDLANELSRERLAPWLIDAEGAAEEAYSLAVARFKTLAQEFLDRLTGAAGLEQAGTVLEAELTSGLQTRRGFYFTDLLYRHEAPTPWRFLFDLLAPPPLARRRWRGAAHRYLDDLLQVNAARVENDLRDRVHESGSRLSSALDRLLADIGTSAKQAVERGMAAKQAGEAATKEALQRLDARLSELGALRSP